MNRLLCIDRTSPALLSQSFSLSPFLPFHFLSSHPSEHPVSYDVVAQVVLQTALIFLRNALIIYPCILYEFINNHAEVWVWWMFVFSLPFFAEDWNIYKALVHSLRESCLHQLGNWFSSRSHPLMTPPPYLFTLSRFLSFFPFSSMSHVPPQFSLPFSYPTLFTLSPLPLLPLSPFPSKILNIPPKLKKSHVE